MNILNRQVLEDVKIYSSSERRVRDTAEVFARWFLDDPESLDGVISESKHLLDDSNAAKDQSDAVKRKLKGLLKPGNNIPEYMLAQMGWSAKFPQPHVILQEISSIMERMQKTMRDNWQKKDIDNIQRRWCCLDSPMLFKERWEKMFRNFTQENEIPDPSWIPALYDSLKYDALHNRPFLQAMFTDENSPPEDFESINSGARTSIDSNSLMSQQREGSDIRRLYKLAKIMFDFVAPQEFGITDTEKKNIGMLISFPLLKKILCDLEGMQSAEKGRTRLYFTKESHVHTLLNLIYLSGVPTKVPKNTLPELDCKYLQCLKSC